MLRERARSRCRQQLALLAESTLDVDSLRLEAIDHLRPFEQRVDLLAAIARFAVSRDR